MKRIMLYFIVVGIAFVAQGKLDPEMAEKVKAAKERIAAMSPEEREAYRAEKEMKHFGGWVVKPNSGMGSVAYVNTSQKISSKFISDTVKEIEDLINCNIMVQDSSSKITISNADRELIKTGSEAAIFIIEDDSLPTILIAAENDWAFINMAALTKDNPDDAKLKRRVEKEVWRVFGQLLGAADSQMGGCILRPVHSLTDLDNLPGKYICPEPLGVIKDHLRHIGIKPYIKTTYRDACRLGWAPTPTNDYQKVIWDKAHAIPAEPIKIKYEKK